MIPLIRSVTGRGGGQATNANIDACGAESPCVDDALADGNWLPLCAPKIDTVELSDCNGVARALGDCVCDEERDCDAEALDVKVMLLLCFHVLVSA